MRRLLTAAPAMATASGGRPLRFRLPDAHAHPQDDMPSAVRLLPAAGDSGVQASAVAVMGVREADWEHVLQLSQLAPAKVIPCFGVHPWFAHQHLAPGTAGDGGPQAEQGSSSNNNSSFAALCEQRGARGGMFTLPRQAAGAPPEELQGLVAALLPAPPSSTWAARLEELLRVRLALHDLYLARLLLSLRRCATSGRTIVAARRRIPRRSWASAGWTAPPWCRAPR